ncbi:MAG: lipoate--protein ligase family protein [Candidatus Marsarchaeota archaeon]|nr:lipoate--protein ligase family protein [Candidatus Marsarchaeota archaeon]
MEFRFLDVEYPENPYLSLATEEAIFHEVMRGRSPPTFRFYRHSNAVILGCFQLAEQEIDSEFAAKNQIHVVKRFTGGGAVYHDLGNLNFSVITRDTFGIGLNVKKLYSTMIEGAVDAFKGLGIPAESGKLNDVTVNGKKILGAAATIREKTLLFHAAVLVDTNLTTLATVLKVPGEKLKDKGVKTILERVTNIKAISGHGIPEVRRALIDGYSKALGIDLREGGLTNEEKELAKELHGKKYTKREWNREREVINLL